MILKVLRVLTKAVSEIMAMMIALMMTIMKVLKVLTKAVSDLMAFMMMMIMKALLEGLTMAVTS